MAFLIDQLKLGLLARHGRPETDAGRILRRLAQGRRAGLIGRAGLMAIVGAGLVWASLAGAEALLAARPSGATADAATLAPEAWLDVNRPIPIYDLAGTEFAKLPRTYQARRRAPDGAREDVMSFGTLGDSKPYLRIVIERHGEGPPEPEGESLADALARSAGISGDVVTRMQPLPPAETRFGTLERADLTLWQRGSSVACRGFRALPDGGHVLTVTGLACRGADRPLDATAAACVVDRIDLLSAGDDQPLRTLFVAAERHPGAAACGGGVLAASIDPPPPAGPFAALRRRAAWLETSSGGPPLRGPLDATDDER